MNAPTGVIDDKTGDLLRWGYVTEPGWKDDGSFDPTTQTIMEKLPDPCYARGQPDAKTMSRWTGKEWIEVAQP